ncbi:MAG: sialidase family protein [Armatimonadota bacterium]|nr:sialidase family protein [Armatimonadota bacterium]
MSVDSCRKDISGQPHKGFLRISKEKTLLRHVTIFRDERFYPSHASAAVAKNGDIFVVFRQAPFENIFAHVHPDARIDMVRSSDMGETWAPAARSTVYDPGDGVNLNDPSITVLKDGTVLVTAFNSYAPRTKDGNRWGDSLIAVRGTDYYYTPSDRWIVLLRSFDNGLTWDGPYTVDASSYSKSNAAVFAPIVELSDGRLLMPISTTRDETGEHIAAIICSTDKGETWSPYSQIAAWSPKGCWMGEEKNMLSFGLPTLAAYDDDRLIAAGWSNFEIGTLVTLSRDGGKTWGPLQPVITKGECTHVCVTSAGTTLLTYGYRRPPYGIRASPSYDGGKTWEPAKAFALRSDGAMRDLGYPRTIQLPDGKLFCVYYFNARDEDKGYYDEEKSLEICRAWNLNPPLYTYQVAGLRFVGGTIFSEEDIAELAGTAIFEPELTESQPTLL